MYHKMHRDSCIFVCLQEVLEINDKNWFRQNTALNLCNDLCNFYTYLNRVTKNLKIQLLRFRLKFYKNKLL